MRKAKEKTKEKIDHIDCNIISLLQNNGRLSNTTIAKKLGISVYELFCLSQIAPNQVIRPVQRLLIGPGTRQ